MDIIFFSDILLCGCFFAHLEKKRKKRKLVCGTSKKYWKRKLSNCIKYTWSCLHQNGDLLSYLLKENCVYYFINIFFEYIQIYTKLRSVISQHWHENFMLFCVVKLTRISKAHLRAFVGMQVRGDSDYAFISANIKKNTTTDKCSQLKFSLIKMILCYCYSQV